MGVNSKGNPRRANGHRRNQDRAYWIRQALPCALCSEPIDYSLPAGDPMAFEIDEIIPVSRYYEGGYSSPEACARDRSNQQPAHRLCNQKKGNGLKRNKSIPSTHVVRTSRAY